jgi:hypothetical protein
MSNVFYAVIRAADQKIVNAGSVPKHALDIQVEPYGPGHFVLETDFPVSEVYHTYRDEGGVAVFEELEELPE